MHAHQPIAALPVDLERHAIAALEYGREGVRVNADIFDRSIDVQILRLRRKIEPNPNEPSLIRTERSVGYFLDVDVTPIR